MKESEDAEKRIVENLMPGARMHYRASQSAGEHDFDFEYPSSTRIPLEVTVSTDEDAEATDAAIMRRGGPFVPRVHCRHDWDVYPIRYANINKIRRHVDSYLAAIEAEGREHFHAFMDAVKSPAVYAILQELGIEYGSVISWKSPGIWIATPGDGGIVDPVLVNEAVEIEAFKADNKRKLSSAEGSEKHLFVYVNSTRHVVWAAVREEAPPVVGPKLPPEITHVWVATWAGNSAWHTVWCAQNGLSWTHMGQVNIETGEVRVVWSNKGMELIAYSVRSCLAPASSSSSYLTLAP
ncbi:MAG: hypothetical protein HY267_03315 [Deltaproteobacteria bacterium]|nr:hypothetical protein [Deltaproteobacteria bacterium]